MPETRKYEWKLSSLLCLAEGSAEGLPFATAVLFEEVSECFIRVAESF
jgi:hypothetical protein